MSETTLGYKVSATDPVSKNKHKTKKPPKLFLDGWTEGDHMHAQKGKGTPNSVLV